jgi:hypothetical protein
MKKFSFIAGIEMEMALPFSFSNNNGYHNTNLRGSNQIFLIESDSSIHNRRDDFHCCEIPFTPFRAEDLKLVLYQFRKFLIESGKEETNDNLEDLEFNELIEINKTMGNHIHFSPFRNCRNISDYEQDIKINYRGKVFTLGHGKKMNNYTISLQQLYHMRTQLFKRLSGQCFFDVFKQQYFRDFARETKLNTFDRGEKYCEFNISSYGTIEWRSLNLMGIKTWKELEYYYDSVFQSIEDGLNYEAQTIVSLDIDKNNLYGQTEETIKEESTQYNLFENDDKYMFPEYTEICLDVPNIIPYKRNIIKKRARIKATGSTIYKTFEEKQQNEIQTYDTEYVENKQFARDSEYKIIKIMEVN